MTQFAAPSANMTHFGLSGVAAVSPTDIAAVGLQFRTDLTQDSMVLEYNGTAWSFAAVADGGAHSTACRAWRSRPAEVHCGRSATRRGQEPLTHTRP